MRIGLTLPCFATGGAEQVVLTLATHFRDLGHEVVIITMSAGGNMRARFLQSGIRLRELGIERSFRLSPFWAADVMKARRQVRRCLEEEALDVLHTHLMGTDIDFLYAAKKTGVKAVVHTIHNRYTQYASTSLSDRLRNWRRAAAYNGYDRVFAVDDEVRDWTIERGMVKSGNITTINNGICLSSLDVRSPRRELREKYGLSHSDRMVLNIGSLTEQKNQKTLIRAVRLARAKTGGINLFIAGEGPLREELSREARAPGAAASVHLLGCRDDIAELLKAADLFVLPSLWEGLPISLLESLACSTPVLASSIPVHRKILGNGRYGWLTPATEPEQIAASLERALDGLGGCAEMTHRAREMVTEKYSAQTMADKHISAYREILKGKGAGLDA